MAPGFIAWLARHKKKQTPIGDLALDWAADRRHPRARTLKGMLAYLESVGACDGALEAARDAWAAYSAERAARPTCEATAAPRAPRVKTALPPRIQDADLRAKLDQLMAEIPLLGAHGVGVLWYGNKTREEREAALVERRVRLSADLEYVRWTMDWLRQNVEPWHKITRCYGSYSLKHIAERYAPGGYISNGCLIAAAILAGYQYRLREDGSPNVCFGMTRRSIKVAADNAPKWGDHPPDFPRAAAGPGPGSPAAPPR